MTRYENWKLKELPLDKDIETKKEGIEESSFGSCSLGRVKRNCFKDT